MDRNRWEGSASPTADVLTAYLEGRGETEDQRWAERAISTAVVDGVQVAAVEAELRGALELVRESAEGPEQLYGPAPAWVRERLAERAERGQPVVRHEPDTAWRDVPVVGSVVASVLSLLILVVWLVRGGLTTDYTWGLILLPLLSGVGIMAALAVWERLLGRHPWSVAALAGVGIFAVGVGFLTWLLWGTRDDVLVTASTFGIGAMVIGYALLAGLLERLLPESPRPGERAASSDEEWERELAGTLRLRLDLDEARVRDIVSEARAHAAESGTNLREEFGPPSAYAVRFPRDRRTAARRSALWRSALVPVAGLLAFGDLLSDGVAWSSVSWSGVALLVLALGLAVSAWRRVGAVE